MTTLLERCQASAASAKRERAEGWSPVMSSACAARLVFIADLGVQETRYGDKAQIALTWELVSAPLDDERNFHLTRTFTKTLGPKSALRKAIEGWLGKKLPDAEAFTLDTLLGEACYLHVTHRETDNGVYANIEGIAPLPQGVTAPPAKSDYVSYSQENPDLIALGKLPAWIQLKVTKDGHQIAANQPVSEEFGDIPW